MVTVTNRTTGGIRKNDSHLSDSENRQINADCALARFDIRSSDSNASHNEKDQNLSDTDAKNSSDAGEDRFFPLNLRCDPQHVLDGMLVLKCLFCGLYKTPIENDMRIHLRNTHQMELLKDLPLSGKGFNMAYRVDFVINIMKQKTPREYYDHESAKFALQEDHRVLSYENFME